MLRVGMLRSNTFNENQFMNVCLPELSCSRAKVDVRS